MSVSFNRKAVTLERVHRFWRFKGQSSSFGRGNTPAKFHDRRSRASGSAEGTGQKRGSAGAEEIRCDTIASERLNRFSCVAHRSKA